MSSAEGRRREITDYLIYYCIFVTMDGFDLNEQATAEELET